MKTYFNLVAVFVLLIVCQTFTSAAIIGDMNWADEVYDWGGNLKNYGVDSAPELMTESTTWWLTGAPDADVDGNGYAWDDVDNDYVAGWKHCGSGDPETFTLKFNTPLSDGDDDDLAFVTYGGPNAESEVLASTDGESFVSLGNIGNCIPGSLETIWLDFDGLIDQVQYVKVLRTATVPQSGFFFDAIGGKVENIPGDANHDGKVDTDDSTILVANWLTGVNNSRTATWEMGDFNGDEKVDTDDSTLLVANWLTGVEATSAAGTVPEPSALVMLIALAGSFLWWCNR